MNEHDGSTSRLDPSFLDHQWYVLTRLRDAILRMRDGHLALAPGDCVVDLGSGSSPYRTLFEERQCRYVACDLDGAVDVRIEIGQPVALPTGSAAGVVSFQVLEHVWDLDWYLAECRRLLKPGGWLLLSTHGVWPYHPHPTDFRRWTRDGLVRELEARGFQVPQVDALVGPLAWTTQIRLLGMQQVLKRLPGVGPFAVASAALVMNPRMVLEDAITPESIRKHNAAVYLVLAHAAA